MWWPKRVRWLGEWEDELQVFNKGKHDDQVDCLAHAALQISNRQDRVSLARWDSTAGILKTAGPLGHHYGGSANIP
ncbi:MAG: hypothetical protein O6834_09545 [Actinobacteria bacterium]|nr:hypothetical protein [Actinomycetota bacterium]